MVSAICICICVDLYLCLCVYLSVCWWVSTYPWHHFSCLLFQSSVSSFTHVLSSFFFIPLSGRAPLFCVNPCPSLSSSNLLHSPYLSYMSLSNICVKSFFWSPPTSFHSLPSGLSTVCLAISSSLTVILLILKMILQMQTHWCKWICPVSSWAPCVEDVSVVKKTEITAWQGNLLLLLLFSGLSAFNFWCNREMVLVHCFPIAGHELP